MRKYQPYVNAHFRARVEPALALWRLAAGEGETETATAQKPKVPLVPTDIMPVESRYPAAPSQ